jgi:hypothetical protein
MRPGRRAEWTSRRSPTDAPLAPLSAWRSRRLNPRRLLAVAIRACSTPAAGRLPIVPSISLVTVGAKRLLVGKRMSRRSWALAVGSGFADRVLSCIEERSG